MFAMCQLIEVLFHQPIARLDAFTEIALCQASASVRSTSEVLLISERFICKVYEFDF